jgi:hypothetical protein
MTTATHPLDAVTPFSSDSLTTGDLTIDNSEDTIGVYGSVDVTRDKAGLDTAEAMVRFWTRVANTLDAEKSKGTLPASQPRIAPALRDNPMD